MNEKQAIFAAEYLIDRNATQAALRAGYSPKTSYAQGSALLKHPEVRAAIADGQIKQQERTQVTQDYVLRRLVIEAEREGEGSSHAARVASVVALGKHMAMFTENIDHKSTDGTMSPIGVTFVGVDPNDPDAA